MASKVLTCSTCNALLAKIPDTSQKSAREGHQKHEGPKECDGQIVPACVSVPSMPIQANHQEQQEMQEHRQAVPQPPQSPHVCKPNKRGRPRKDEAPNSRWSLRAHIRETRSQVYMQTSRSFDKSATYFCKACQREIKIGSQTCKAKLDAHEGCATHQTGLKRLARAAVSSDPACQMNWPALLRVPGWSGVPTAVTARTAPHALRKPPGVLGSMPAAESALLSRSFPSTAWSSALASLCTCTVYSQHESDPLSNVTFEAEGDCVYVRSDGCEQIVVRGGWACKARTSLCQSKAFRQCVAQKCCLIDTAVYSWKLFHASPVELETFKESLLERDYAQQRLAGVLRFLWTQRLDLICL